MPNLTSSSFRQHATNNYVARSALTSQTELALRAEVVGGVDNRSGHYTFEWLLCLTSTLQAFQRQPLVLSEPVPRQLPVHSSPLYATIVSSAAENLNLTPFVSSLVPEPGMLAPRFFLASLLPRHCRPCVVVVSQGHRVVGLLYGQERIVAGIPIGIVLGDDTLGTMVAARPEDMESVLRCAVEALLKHKAALRFRVASDRLAFLRNESAKANADIHFYREQHHAHLELPRTYDEFLAKVRRPTRHNLCRYRRRSELVGNEFCPDQPFADFCAAAKRLYRKAAYPRPKRDFQRYLAMIEAMPSRLLIGLRRRGGDWISLAAGWHVGGCAFLALQLNDRTRRRESVSLVLRSYLIEQLIKRGIRELVFWGGTSEPLSFYTVPREEFTAYIDSRSHPWRLVRRACVGLAKVAPVPFGNCLRWKAPDANAKQNA
jgi:hypothetical protein